MQTLAGCYILARNESSTQLIIPYNSSRQWLWQQTPKL